MARLSTVPDGPDGTRCLPRRVTTYGGSAWGTPDRDAPDPGVSRIEGSTMTVRIHWSDQLPVKPRRSPNVPEWNAYGYRLDGRQVPVRIVPVKLGGHVEAVLQVDDDPPVVLYVDGLAQLVANLRSAGEHVGFVERSRREPGRWQ